MNGILYNILYALNGRVEISKLQVNAPVAQLDRASDF